MKYNGDEKRAASWHMSKEVTVSTLFAILLSVVGGVSAYSDINNDISTIQRDMKDATDDRIRKATVVQMFENKDIQIQAVKADVQKLQRQSEKIENKLDKQYELLLELSQSIRGHN